MVNITDIDSPKLTWEESIYILDNLPGMSFDARAEAVKKLLRNPSPGIRQRALRIGAAVLSDEQLLSFIRDDADDVIRNAGLEILKLKGGHSFALAMNLLKDSDEDVVLQAILILDHLRDPRAFYSLRTILRHENTNLVQAAITGIGHLGNTSAIPDLIPFLKADPWLQIAAVQALGDIRSAAAVRPLKELLPDLFLGTLAAEALARIGGSKGFRALAEHWVKFHERLEAETTLGLLAHVLESLSRKPGTPADFLKTLSPYLESNEESVRTSAARCMLMLGPNEKDKKAIYALALSNTSSHEMPGCFARRKDLISALLKMDGLPLLWGVQLSALFPKDTPVTALDAALQSPEVLEHVELTVPALRKIKDPLLAKSIFKLFIRQSEHSRRVLIPLLSMYRSRLLDLIERFIGLDEETRLVLAAYLGESPAKIIRGITSLPVASHITIISQISNQKSICKYLPWAQWLEKDPIIYAPLAARVAVDTRLHDIAPLLRNILRNEPLTPLISALGELEDRESVPILVTHLPQANPLIKAVIMETLGRIGGPVSRTALQEFIEHSEGKETGFAYRALSQCVVEDDVPFFQKAITHHDWMVRLACAEVFGRFPNTENLEHLTRLSADPVNAVAQRALSFIEGKEGSQ